MENICFALVGSIFKGRSLVERIKTLPARALSVDFEVIHTLSSGLQKYSIPPLEYDANTSKWKASSRRAKVANNSTSSIIIGL